MRSPERQQVEWRELSLDDTLPEDHEARGLWAYVAGLDLSALEAQIQSVAGGAGHPAADPRLLTALWLYATFKGVGSARELDRLCREHLVYRWLCGGVSVNYHSLADFRVAHEEFLEALLTASVAALLEQELVSLERVAQDGMRVRASAGAASFRRQKTLESCLEQAEEQMAALKAEAAGDGAAGSRRRRAARERAARERQARVTAALAVLPEVAAKKKAGEREQARASTTDPEARVMKMADGGFRPAHNVQFATDTGSGFILGVEVTNSGSDMGQLAPMVKQIEARCGQPPGAMLVDGGYTKLEDIEQVSGRTEVYAPVPKPKDPARDPHQPLARDSEAVAAWRVRMGTAEAKASYKERAATAELVNAQARNHGLRQLPVRGQRKVRCIALWYAHAENFRRLLALGLLGR
ncbi:MAG: IS1182 family transposase [Armatimonadetes bacterium]|nr:IS1182 family transposase [Armatimonadota bacterium]